MVQTVRRTKEIPFDKVVDVLLHRLCRTFRRGAEADPMVLLTVEIPQLLFDVVACVPGVQVQRVPQVLSWRRQPSSLSCTCRETHCVQLSGLAMS